jgi:hypothetical protein
MYFADPSVQVVDLAFRERLVVVRSDSTLTAFLGAEKLDATT